MLSVHYTIFVSDEGELHRADYLKIGAITDFKYAVEVGRPFRNDNPFHYYKDFGKYSECLFWELFSFCFQTILSQLF